MFTLLIIIYVAFISLGLPDSLLGSAWPSMYQFFGVSLSSAGIISMIISAGTIISSLFSDRLIRKWNTGFVTFVSVFMTALALLGFSFSNHFFALCFWAIPLGLGAGSVDAGLNNFVALHYKAHHMSWLHCFWGLGASLGPIIMSYCLLQLDSWRIGYRSISIIQFTLVAVLLFSLPLWKKIQGQANVEKRAAQSSIKLSQVLKLPGAKAALVSFFCYCALESTVGLWGSTYLVTIHAIAAGTAARWISLYYIGITLGRFLSGFLAMKLSHEKMVRIGQCFIGAGILLLFLPFSGPTLMVGLFLVGLGCAPIFPSLLHETPENFGSRYSQTIMGIQMASAYVGTTFMPPLFGFLGAKISYHLFPVFNAAILLLMIVMVTIMYRNVKKIDMK